MTNQTMHIFFPLKVTAYLLNDYDWDDQNPVEISSEEAVSYEDAIRGDFMTPRTVQTLSTGRYVSCLMNYGMGSR
ncbi:hypothetical protein ACHOLT_17895 [Desulfitobacterium sp. Sab5]|uniref:hypothetical protein n=1 Tax=Desulfitobacterium nosdiversum TaxID=3375356 RepID=UPI003CF82A2E